MRRVVLFLFVLVAIDGNQGQGIAKYIVKCEGSATRSPDSKFKRFCQIFIKIRDLSQDLKYFKSLEYCEMLSLLAVNT